MTGSKPSSAPARFAAPAGRRMPGGRGPMGGMGMPTEIAAADAKSAPIHNFFPTSL